MTSLLNQLKPEVTKATNGLGPIMAWCIKRVKFLFCVVGVLVTWHLLQQMDAITGLWKVSTTHRAVIDETTLPAWKRDEIIAENLPSLPYVKWKANKDKRWNLKCGQYPYIYDVAFFNTYWQTFKLQNYSVQIFGAYYDNRAIFGGKSFVRLYTLINGYMPNINGLQGNNGTSIPAHCQLWYDSQDEPVVVNVSSVKYPWVENWGVDKTGGYEPHFLACELPRAYDHVVPSSVTLVENACDKATNHLKVMNERPTVERPKTEFGVCVRNAVFPFEDKSIRYIEWIELQLAMGASQIYFYVMDVHPNIEKVFKYYEALGKIRVSYVTYPTGSPNIRGLPLEYQNQNGKTVKWETISLNDCYYRNMYKHEFLAMLDPDEVLMPKGQFKNWHEMFAAVEQDSKIKRDDYNSFNFQHSYFLDYPQREVVKDISSYLYMFQHVDRVAEYSPMGKYIKSFHNTANCLAMHNHYPVLCVQRDEIWCHNFWLNNSVGQLNHYRHDCRRWKNVCDLDIEKRERDTNIWKWKDNIVPKILETMKSVILI